MKCSRYPGGINTPVLEGRIFELHVAYSAAWYRDLVKTLSGLRH